MAEVYSRMHVKQLLPKLEGTKKGMSLKSLLRLKKPISRLKEMLNNLADRFLNKIARRLLKDVL